LSELTGAEDTQAGVSARIRDLRKKKFGGWVVERVRTHEQSGLHVYRMRNPDGSALPPVKPAGGMLVAALWSVL
jgi:hypothetical protein